MKFHFLQHVPFEGPGYIDSYAREFNVETSFTRLYQKEILPDGQDIDLLIILGGPMSVHDTVEYPWLLSEKEFVRQFIKNGGKVLGICLGAQIIAEVLGGKVTKNDQKEIGWFPVAFNQISGLDPIDEQIVFHWHGETFSIPEGAQKIASSVATLNQGFIYDGRAVALQFHLETTFDSMNNLIDECRHEMVTGKYIQSVDQIHKLAADHIPSVNLLMKRLLTRLLAK